MMQASLATPGWSRHDKSERTEYTLQTVQMTGIGLVEQNFHLGNEEGLSLNCQAN